MFNFKKGDLIQFKISKELCIIIDDFDQEKFEALNTTVVSNMSRKILTFTERGPEINFTPNFNIALIKSEKEENDT
jgi:hypothetical protein